MYNGIDFDKFPYVKRSKGFNLAWIGYLNLRKNPMLVLQYFYELVKRDKRYQLYIAGSFQDEALMHYMQDMIERLSLERNVHFDGFIPHDKMNEWLKDKHYLITGSIAEGHPVGVMEAMASGLKPVIHYFPGSEAFYPKSYLYYDLESFLKNILSEEYSSIEYRNYIKENYSFPRQLNTIKKILGCNQSQAAPLVTIGIIDVKNSCFEACLQSVLQQEYDNKEILIFETTSKSLNCTIQAYSEKYPEITVIAAKRKAENADKEIRKMQQYIKGEYVTYIQAENFYPNPKVISNYVEAALGADKPDFVYGSHALVNESNEVVNVFEPFPMDLHQFVQQIQQDVSLPYLSMQGLYKVEFFKQKQIEWYHYDSDGGINTLMNYLSIVQKQGTWKKVESVTLCLKSLVQKNDLTSVLKQIISAFDYLIQNFSEKVYLSNINWLEIQTEQLSQSEKMYHIGNLFYQIYLRCLVKYSLYAIDVRQAERLFLQMEALEHRYLKYFQHSLKANDRFSLAIQKNKEEVAAFKRRLKSFGTSDLGGEWPKVSVVIPTYNRKEMLQEALESIIEQDYENLEIIVTDNASTDGTDKLMEQYKSDPRVEYFRHEINRGPGHNFWYGCTVLATGEFLLFLDDDDYLIDHQYISKAMNLVKNNPNTVLVYANAELLNLSDHTRSYTNYQTSGVFNGFSFFLNYERNQNCPHITGNLTSLMKRSLLTQKLILHIDAHNTLAGDLISYLFLMLYGKGTIGILPDCVGVYRIHPENLSNGLKSFELQGEKRDGTIASIEKLAERAVGLGVPQEVIRPWLDYRIWRFARWCCCEFLPNGDIEKCLELLESIKLKHPNPFHALKQEFFDVNI